MKNHWRQLNRDTHVLWPLVLKRTANGWRVQFHPTRHATVGQGRTLYGAKASVEQNYRECRRQWHAFYMRMYFDGIATRDVT